MPPFSVRETLLTQKIYWQLIIQSNYIVKIQFNKTKNICTLRLTAVKYKNS